MASPVSHEMDGLRPAIVSQGAPGPATTEERGGGNLPDKPGQRPDDGRMTVIAAAPGPATVTYRLQPIDPGEADRLRASSPDAPRYTADVHPGYPCRQCLRDAAVGEEVVLVSHDPFTTDSPYRSASPIFLHRGGCEPPQDLTTLPAQLTGRQLSVRAFDTGAMMIDAAVIEGTSLAATLDRFFALAACDHVHVHNASRGCWATRVGRAR